MSLKKCKRAIAVTNETVSWLVGLVILIAAGFAVKGIIARYWG